MILCNLLRVPPIFIMDELFKSSFGLPELTDMLFPVKNDLEIYKMIDFNYDSAIYYKAILVCVAKIIASCLSKYINQYSLFNIHDNCYRLIKSFCIHIFPVFCSSSCLFVLPTKYLYIVYFHVVSICVILLSYWTNIHTLKVLSGKYENFKTDITDEIITWDIVGILHLLAQLQVLDFLYIICRNILLQFCLSIVFDILQAFTTYHSIPIVSYSIQMNVFQI